MATTELILLPQGVTFFCYLRFNKCQIFSVQVKYIVLINADTVASSNALVYGMRHKNEYLVSHLHFTAEHAQYILV